MNADTWSALAAFAAAAAILCVLCWALRSDDYRTRNDRRQAAKTTASGPHPEPDQPGTNDQLLAACRQICPDLARKED